MGDGEFETLGLAPAGQIYATAADRAHVFEYAGSTFEIVEFGHGKLNISQAHSRFVEKDSYQSIRLAVGERTQKDGIHDAEHGRVGSDSQSQGQDGDDGECGLFAQHAQCVTNILK
jgi:hypothetical protein